MPGGKGANQALAARRLGADVTLVAAVGTDDAAGEALALLDRDGVDLGRLRRVRDEPTGVALITVDGAGENTIVVVPGQERTPRSPSRPPTSTAPTRSSASSRCRWAPWRGRRAGTGIRAVLPNPAPAAPVPEAVLARADLVVANRAEAAAVPGLDRAGLVAVTAGEEGAVLRRGGEEVARATRRRVTAVDGTAAGDAFTGALVVGLLSGAVPAGRPGAGLRRGRAPAARPGAQPSLPGRGSSSQERAPSEPESPQGERGADEGRAVRARRAALSEERALSEPESPQGERGATRAGRSELARTALSEERALSEPESPQGERGATRAGRSELARTALSEERARASPRARRASGERRGPGGPSREDRPVRGAGTERAREPAGDRARASPW